MWFSGVTVLFFACHISTDVVIASSFPSTPFPSSSQLPRHFDQVSSQCRQLSTPQAKELSFSDARKELSPFDLPGSSSICSTDNFDTKMILHSLPGSLTFPLNHSLVTYGRVFKVNSENIVYSFLNISTQTPSSQRISEKREKSSATVAVTTTQKEYDTSSKKVFSFFRHPIHHFLSGVVESHYRQQCDVRLYFTKKQIEACIQQIQNQEEVMTRNHAQKIFLSIFSCEENYPMREYLADIRHFALQSTCLMRWKPQFIGYLEYFTTHWKELEV
jgi:hypothetical protein